VSNLRESVRVVRVLVPRTDTRYDGWVIQVADVLVVFAVHEAPDGWTLRSLADRLGVKHSKVQRALDRLAGAGIYDANRRRLIPHAVEEFMVHALRYLHPIREGPMTRGVPTAWGAKPLSDEISASEPPPVWPDPRGAVLGPAVEPLDPRLPALVREWPEVAELASLSDALLLGDARVRAAAERHLRQRLG
jgi:DNA-binding transcriptional MocR family regulator